MIPLSRVALLAVAVAMLAALAGCGGDERADDGAAADEGPVHVHGLGINPADGALFIATHTGLFRVGSGESRAKRVDDQFQDTMGFTIAGRDRFLGSGHPAPGEDRPPNLGLISSGDAGRSWEEVSLSGEADFHSLEFAHGRVYGYDSGGRVMISANLGRSWTEREPPAALLDLAVDPDDRRRIVATGEGGTYSSSDEGRRWRPLGERAGFLAWPERRALYLVDGRGNVLVSRDGGRRWRAAGEIGGQPAALMARGERELYAALGDGTILRSRDGGASWKVRSRP